MEEKGEGCGWAVACIQMVNLLSFLNSEHKLLRGNQLLAAPISDFLGRSLKRQQTPLVL